jgi:hypothetical protein
MKVLGCSSQSSPTRATRPKNLPCGASETFKSRARRSTNQKPTLCRLSSYSPPGLPRPTIRRGAIICTCLRKQQAAAGTRYRAAACLRAPTLTQQASRLRPQHPRCRA